MSLNTAATPDLSLLTPERLRGIRRGVEKESLRTSVVEGRPSLAQTPHPEALGSALTHPFITTDFSEAQLELITGVHASVEACAAELERIQRFVCHHLPQGERIWVSSMPCCLPEDHLIPLGYYGTSNSGRSKTVYRHGLGLRYGRRMQTISGIHYNWSLPGLSSADYFALIRNFRRYSFVLMYLLGASPAVCSSFVAGRTHALQALPHSDNTLHLPYATSLRMGRLGYQSDAQSSLRVSYNSLEGYAHSLEQALTQPYPAYVTHGVRDSQGHYQQLATTLLQIENEFYSTIRPKRVTQPGQRPLHALRQSGVEYVEVRLLDLNPLLPMGIDTAAMRMVDLFLLYCATTSSANDSPAEIAEILLNQQSVAERGRDPGLMLVRDGQQVALRDWANAVWADVESVAQIMDAQLGTGDAYHAAWRDARARLDDDALTPSAQVLRGMVDSHQSHVGWVQEQSERTHASMVGEPLSVEEQGIWQGLALRSVQEQHDKEAADSQPFDQYLQHYLAPQSLRP